MKKFFLMIMMALFTVSMTSAQAVHEGKMFDNVYTTVSVGAVNPTTVWNGVKNVRPEFGIEVGKRLTTLYTTGLELKGVVNTTKAKTAFDQMTLSWMHKVNVSNIIWGYCPDAKWDFNVVGGLGWGHDMVVRDNYGVVQTGFEVSYSVNKAFSIVAKPHIEWNHVNDGLNVDKSRVGLQVGITYKFPNKYGYRGFYVCDREYLAELVNQLRADNELKEQALNGQKEINRQLNDTLAVYKAHACETPDTVFITKPIGPTIGFTINSAVIDPHQEMNVINIAKNYSDKKIVVKGYADAATGTPEYNMELSGKRAEAVKQLLIKHGVKAENITTVAEGGQINLNSFYTSDYMNRCVLFTIE